MHMQMRTRVVKPKLQYVFPGDRTHDLNVANPALQEHCDPVPAFNYRMNALFSAESAFDGLAVHMRAIIILVCF